MAGAGLDGAVVGGAPRELVACEAVLHAAWRAGGAGVMDEVGVGGDAARPAAVGGQGAIVGPGGGVLLGAVVGGVQREEGGLVGGLPSDEAISGIVAQLVVPGVAVRGLGHPGGVAVAVGGAVAAGQNGDASVGAGEGVVMPAELGEAAIGVVAPAGELAAEVGFSGAAEGVVGPAATEDLVAVGGGEAGGLAALGVVGERPDGAAAGLGERAVGGIVGAGVEGLAVAGVLGGAVEGVVAVGEGLGAVGVGKSPGGTV